MLFKTYKRLLSLFAFQFRKIIVIGMLFISFSITCLLFGIHLGQKELEKNIELTQEIEEIKDENISIIKYFEQYVNYDKMNKVLLNYDERVLFDYFSTKYCKKYRIPQWLPYLFAQIESDFSLTAYNKGSGATGLFQITKICLEEYNNFHTIKITNDELWDIETNFEVAFWYINRLVNHYNIPFNRENQADLYIAYNIGPGNYKKHKTWSETTYKRYIASATAVNMAYIDEKY